MSFDNVCKFLAEQYPQVFVKWLLDSEETSIRVLKTELNVNPIQADSVLFLRVGKRILHLEFQTEPKSKPPLPLRMLDYYIRLKRKYNYPITQIIIFLQKSNSEFVFKEQYQMKILFTNIELFVCGKKKQHLFYLNLFYSPLPCWEKLNFLNKY